MAALAIYRAFFERQIRRERVFRDRMNPSDVYNDDEIYERFRFRRRDILTLVDIVIEDLRIHKRKGN